MRTAGGAIGGLYFLYFATVGVVLPFLFAYFKSLGLSATEVEVLVAVGPAFALLSPPFWGHLADRSGRPDRVMAVIGLGATAGFAPLVWVESFGALLFALCGYAFFASSATYVARRVPSRLRATGQALFVSVSFGLGGLLGYPASGMLYDAFGGGHRVFLLASALERVAALIALTLERAESRAR